MVWTLTKSENFWTTYLPCLVNVVCERLLTESSRKVLVKFRRKQWNSVHEVMRFPLKEEEFAKLQRLICNIQEIGSDFFHWISFFYGNHVIFLFPFWPLIKVYFLFSCKCFVMSFFEKSWWWWAYLFVTLFMVFSLPWELGNKKNIRTPGITSQLYIQLVYRPHFGTWILLLGPFW